MPRRPPDRDRIHHQRGTFRRPARRREAALAQPPLRGQVRHPVAPGTPHLAEHADFKDLVTTYGRRSIPGHTTVTIFRMDPAANHGPDRGRPGQRSAGPRPDPGLRNLRRANAAADLIPMGASKGSQLLGERPDRADAPGGDGVQAAVTGGSPGARAAQCPGCKTTLMQPSALSRNISYPRHIPASPPSLTLRKLSSTGESCMGVSCRLV